jgi:hypothetical protein
VPTKLTLITPLPLTVETALTNLLTRDAADCANKHARHPRSITIIEGAFFGRLKLWKLRVMTRRLPKNMLIHKSQRPQILIGKTQ